ncbi:hypothetical protein GALL_207670 [mine drainage metagenome]|uniref:Uncharacterized protein n=1 Tax=mine drainage metagenome TaxID=410659 RepID=A0A1J5SAE7_9ZZZZ
MSLHAIAAAALAGINPPQTARWQSAQGYQTAADGSRTPLYAPPVTVSLTQQPATPSELAARAGLDQTSQYRSFTLPVAARAASRPDQGGGDLLTLADGSLWLVVAVLEDWFPQSGWVRVLAERQMPS